MNFVIYLVTRCYYSFEHPQNENTPSDDLHIYCDTREEYDRQVAGSAENCSAEILHEFKDEGQHIGEYVENWYREWSDPRKAKACQLLFSDDGGDGVTEPDPTDNHLYAGTVG